MSELKAYAVTINLYVLAPNDLEAVRNCIELTDKLNESPEARANFTNIVEIGGGVMARAVNVVENVNKILAENKKK